MTEPAPGGPPVPDALPADHNLDPWAADVPPEPVPPPPPPTSGPPIADRVPPPEAPGLGQSWTDVLRGAPAPRATPDDTQSLPRRPSRGRNP